MMTKRAKVAPLILILHLLGRGAGQMGANSLLVLLPLDIFFKLIDLKAE